MSSDVRPPVLVVSTWSEGEAIKSVLDKEVIVVSVSSGIRAVEGLRVGAISATQAALENQGYREVYEVLLRSQIKSGYKR